MATYLELIAGCTLHNAISGQPEFEKDVISSLRSSDSEFGIDTALPPYLETAMFAAQIIAWGEGVLKMNFDEEKGRVDRFIRKHLSKKGGFADSQGGDPHVFACYYGAISLGMIGCLDKSIADSTAQFLLDNAVAHGGLPAYEDVPSTMLNCFWGAVAASVVGRHPKEIYGNRLLEFAESCRDRSGYFQSRPEASQTISLSNTGMASVIISMYKKNIDGDEIARLLSAARSGDGTFGELPGARPTLNATFMAQLLCSKLPLTLIPPISIGWPIDDGWRLFIRLNNIDVNLSRSYVSTAPSGPHRVAKRAGS